MFPRHGIRYSPFNPTSDVRFSCWKIAKEIEEKRKFVRVRRTEQVLKSGVGRGRRRSGGFFYVDMRKTDAVVVVSGESIKGEGKK